MLTKKVNEKSKLGIKIIALGWCEAKKNCSGHLFLCKEYLYSVLYYYEAKVNAGLKLTSNVNCNKKCTRVAKSCN